MRIQRLLLTVMTSSIFLIYGGGGAVRPCLDPPVLSGLLRGLQYRNRWHRGDGAYAVCILKAKANMRHLRQKHIAECC